MASNTIVFLLALICYCQRFTIADDPFSQFTSTPQETAGQENATSDFLFGANETNIDITSIQVTQVNVLQLFVVPLAKMKLRSFDHLPGCNNDAIRFIRSSNFDPSMKRHVFRSVSAVNAVECANLCHTHFFCRSAGYQASNSRCLLSYKRSLPSCDQSINGEGPTLIDDIRSTDWFISGARDGRDIHNETVNSTGDYSEIWLDCDRCVQMPIDGANSSINATDLESISADGLEGNWTDLFNSSASPIPAALLESEPSIPDSSPIAESSSIPDSSLITDPSSITDSSLVSDPSLITDPSVPDSSFITDISFITDSSSTPDSSLIRDSTAESISLINSTANLNETQPDALNATQLLDANTTQVNGTNQNQTTLSPIIEAIKNFILGSVDSPNANETAINSTQSIANVSRSQHGTNYKSNVIPASYLGTNATAINESLSDGAVNGREGNESVTPEGSGDQSNHTTIAQPIHLINSTSYLIPVSISDESISSTNLEASTNSILEISSTDSLEANSSNSAVSNVTAIYGVTSNSTLHEGTSSNVTLVYGASSNATSSNGTDPNIILANGADLLNNTVQEGSYLNSVQEGSYLNSPLESGSYLNITLENGGNSNISQGNASGLNVTERGNYIQGNDSQLLISATDSTENSISTIDTTESSIGATEITGSSISTTDISDFSATDITTTDINGINTTDNTIPINPINSNTLYIPSYLKGDDRHASTSEAPEDEESTNTGPVATTRRSKIYTRRPFTRRVEIEGSATSQGSTYQGEESGDI